MRHNVTLCNAVINRQHLQCFNIAVIGPSLIDLEAITGSTTSELSTIFMIRGAMSVVGCLLIGPLLDYANVFLVMSVALFANAALYGAMPWCRSLAAVLGVLSPPEFFNAATTMGESHRGKSIYIYIYTHIYIYI